MQKALGKAGRFPGSIKPCDLPFAAGLGGGHGEDDPDEPIVISEAQTTDDSGWDAELARTLYALLCSEDARNGRFETRLKKLEQTYDDVVYSELIYLLSHLRIPPEEARQDWHRITEHRKNMEERLGLPVDLRIALASYFTNVNCLLKNPKIIEMQLFEQTRASAFQDGLTGLRNYRYFSDFLPREIARSEQYHSPVSLVMADVDDFKKYNDRNGHQAGNVALTEIARLLGHGIRKVDVLARYGGEEFALILPSTPKVATAHVAERAREVVERHRFSADGSPNSGRLTISLGVATFPADATTPDELVRHADAAMYQAKTAGKNRVHYFGDSLRSFRRVRTALPGMCTTPTSERLSLTTVNLSIGGLLFRIDRRIEADSLIEVRFDLPNTKHSIEASGRVVYVSPAPGTQFEIAMRIVEIDPNTRWHLAEYIRTEA